MSPDEHQLINGLFERMRQMGPIEKDRDAESFIMQSVLATPDAAYKLVQSVLVQEMALQQANERIEQLEAQTRQPAPQVAQQSSGGFFGGLFGGNKPAPQQPVQRASVPPMGGARPAGSPWSGQQAAPGGYQQQPMQQQAGGGFMKTAMATAAGVAGGMLVAGAIGNMMSGGGTARAAGTGDQASGGAGGGETSPYEVAQGGQEPQYQDPSANDPGTYEQQADTSGDEGGGGWFGGGGDDGGGDSEF